MELVLRLAFRSDIFATGLQMEIKLNMCCEDV